MEHMRLLSNKTQRANLLKLSNYLEKLDELYFDMRSFVYYKNDDHHEEIAKEFKNECGTVGCAVGHGPNAGIKTSSGEDWSDYSERCFVKDLLFEDIQFEWLFGSAWDGVDNLPSSTAKRIKYTLKYGVPEDCEDQRYGITDLVYQ